MDAALLAEATFLLVAPVCIHDKDIRSDGLHRGDEVHDTVPLVDECILHITDALDHEQALLLGVQRLMVLVMQDGGITADAHIQIAIGCRLTEELHMPAMQQVITTTYKDLFVCHYTLKLLKLLNFLNSYTLELLNPLQVPQVLMPTDFRRFKRAVDNDGDSRIADRHGRRVLQFPSHHRTPHERSFLCRDGFLGIPSLAVACLHLHEIQLSLPLGDDVNLLVLVPPVPCQYLEAIFLEVVHSYILTPFAKVIMVSHQDVRAGLQDLDFQFRISPFHFLQRLLDTLITCQEYAHAAVSLNEGLAEEADLHIGL